MSTVLFLLGQDKLQVGPADLQAFTLTDEQINNILSEDEYRKILNNYEDEFIIVNTDRTFKYISPKLLETHGYTPEETKTLNVLTFIHPKDLPEFSLILMEFHKSLEVKKDVGPIRTKLKSGSYINYLITLVPFTDNKGERVGTGVVLKNIDKPLGDTQDKA